MNIYENLDKENLEKEEWKVYPLCEKYSISNMGRIKNNKTGKILKQRIGTGKNQGYCKVTLSDNNSDKKARKKRDVRVHRAVMIAFDPIENYEDYQVDHINGIRTDNRLENLRWTSNLTNNGYKNINREKINTKVNELLQKYGYEKLLEKLQGL